MKTIETNILGAKNIITAIILALFFSLLCHEMVASSFVFAHTTTLSTSGLVQVDVSSNADKAAMGEDQVVVTSTCPLGYTLSIGGPTDNTLYKGGDDTSSDMIVPTTGTTATPKALVGEGNLGTWGYTTTTGTTATSANFIGLTNTPALITSKASGSATGGDTISVYYGVSVDNTIEPGLYKMSNNNAVTYYLTASANCSIYKIQYNDNGANSSTTMGITHNNVHEDDEVTLAASNYKRTGYGFAGWSTIQLNPGSATFQSDLATAKAAGQVFGPNETITANASFISHATVVNSEQIITLYAIWVPSAGNIQNWTGCDSMSTGQVTALTDQRDSDTYAVAKLADGNCWMIENLRLDYDASHNSDGTLAQGYGEIFAGLAQPETAHFTANNSDTTANSLYYSGTQSGTATIDIGTNYYPGRRFPRYNNVNTSSSASNPTTENAAIYSYGNYYTWHAAIADASFKGTGVSVNSTSICPTGWRLPKGGNKTIETNNEIWELIVNKLNNGIKPANYDSSDRPEYSGSAEATPIIKLITSYPNNFLSSSGLIETASVFSRGYSGSYWTSTAMSSDFAYRLIIDKTSPRVDPAMYGYSKPTGYSVRCIASTEYTITLNGNGATAAGSASTTATYGQNTLSTITNPTRSYTISGFTGPAGNNADGATISSTSTLTSNYTFNGWYKESGATNLIASNATTPVLQANTDYTDSNGNWNYNSGVTLYAGWTGQSKTLPTITRNGYSCGWTETATGATSIQYASGSSLTPSSNKTLYGVCICPAGSICYDDNGANSSTTMGLQSVASNATSVGLWASNFKRSNYGFAGWNTAADGSGTNYGPNETIDNTTTLNTIKNNGLRLYAKWVASAGNLQGWTGCSSMSTGQVTALKDTRDNDVYAVAKLADGNCWMIENLRLDYDANITTSNTQSNNNAFGGVFSGLAQPETANFSGSTTANTLYKSDGSGDIAGVNGATLSDIGTTNSPDDRMPRYRNDNTNTNSTINPNVNTNNMTSTDQNIYSYGNYYTWSAAIADTSYYDTNNQSVTTTSLCPSGWRLPKGGNKTRIVSDDDNEFWNLIVDELNNGTLPANYDSSTKPYYTGSEEATPVSKLVRTYPNNFLYSGYSTTSSVYDRGSYGRYWSSTADSSNYSYDLRLYSTYVYPGTGNRYKSSGLSIRCLANKSYTVSFNANGGTGTMAEQRMNVGENINLSVNSFNAPTPGQSYQNASGTTISGTTYTYWTFDGWNTAPDGSGTSYTNGQSVVDLAADGGNITLYAQWKGNEGMRVNFNGNGGTFSNNTNSNIVYYRKNCVNKYVSTSRNSHTSNINNSGAQIGETTYSSDLATKDVITISGADSLHATITYGTEQGFDKLFVIEGEYTGSVTNDIYDAFATYTGGENNTTTVELDIPGDTATFAFYSDGSVEYWGYYVSVVGYYDEEPASYDHTTQVCHLDFAAGDYEVPDAGSHKLFRGWSESSSATTPTYDSEGDIMENLSGNNGQTKTLYAVYDDLWIMTFVNTATNETQTRYVVQGDSTVITPPVAWSREGYKLVGWDTNSAGTTAVYDDMGYLVPSSDRTFYTVWGMTYTINYNGNNADAGKTMSVTHNVTANEEVSLYPPNYKRTGYGFAGWSTEQLDPDSANFQTNLADAVAANKVYGSHAVINAPAYPASGNTITLYAIWVKPETNANLQNWTGCSSLNIGDVRALKDTRDNDVYAVAKLADGKCWMIENLRLTNKDSNNNTIVLSSSNTNNPSLPIVNSRDQSTGNILTSSNSLSASQGTWCDSYDDACTFQSMIYSSSDNSVTEMTNLMYDVYSFGTYYNWYSATAGNGNSVSVEKAVGDICPAGWRLPRGGDKAHQSTNDFWSLIVDGLNGGVKPENYNSTMYPYYSDRAEAGPVDRMIRDFPNNFIRAGSVTNGEVWGPTATIRYWASTSNDNSPTANALESDNLRVVLGGHSWPRYYGFPIRCMVKAEYTISYNANDGTGTMSDQAVEVGDIVNLNPNSFTRTNYIFAGWNTAANGSGTSYTDGQSVSNLATVGGTITLYAQWQQLLYDKVASMTKGTQTNNTNTTTGIQATITTTNSGVYTYSSSVFGAATDASSDYNIYYYRGILEPSADQGTYGSDGKATTYPNYVRLDNNTCWRIVRTTGSGGVKMIYNGTWGSNTCAKSTTNAQISSPVTTSTFNGASGTANNSRQIVRVGYTHNSNYASTSTTSTSFTTVMGSNSDYSVNNTNSTVKGNVESWYNSNMTSYTNMLEPNAGYCNDRMSYTTSTGTTATSNIRPYTTNTGTGGTYVAYFAGYQRNLTTARTPSLGCTSSRNIVDIYSTDTSAGGNGQLSAPVGLLTADEASFAGSGSSTASQGSSYNAKSFLRTGSIFWTMTPSYRNQYNSSSNTSTVQEIAIVANGSLAATSTNTANGIRPVISLKHGATIGSGDGTATSPWTLAKYTVNYNSNGGSGTMSSQSIYNGFEIPLSSNTFTAPTNKVFLNWNTAADGSGTSYGNEESVSDLAMAGGSVTLYAQWIEGTYIQDFTNAMCQSQASSSNAIVYDARDGNDYTVRYINGNCWMTQNLRFTGNSLNSTTSNVASTYTTSSPLILNWHKLKEADSSGGVCVPSLDGYTAPCRRVPDAADLAEIGDTADNVGVWYNYVGATAGTITGTSTTEDVYNVCPKNWTLPTQAQQNSVVSYVSAFSPVLSGAYNPDFKDGMSKLTTGGSETAIWSSTAADNNIFPYRYYILGNNSSLSVSSFKTGDPANTYFGYNIRCIRKN